MYRINLLCMASMLVCVPLLAMMTEEDEVPDFSLSNVSSESEQEKKEKRKSSKVIITPSFDDLTNIPVQEEGDEPTVQSLLDELIDENDCVEHQQELKGAMEIVCKKYPKKWKKYIRAHQKKTRGVDFLGLSLQANEIFKLAVEELLSQKDEKISDQDATIAKKVWQQRMASLIGGGAFIAQFTFMILLLIKQFVNC